MIKQFESFSKEENEIINGDIVKYMDNRYFSGLSVGGLYIAQEVKQMGVGKWIFIKEANADIPISVFTKASKSEIRNYKINLIVSP